jgi:putative ABC transport system permease protein
MADLWRDIQYAARTLRKAPGFAALAILTLALGIGANSALFSVINAVLLRPLPYREADRLVFLTEWSEQVPEMSFSVANFKDLRDQSRVFESLVASNGTSFILTGAGGEPERLNARRVSSGFFATLGKQPILGRAFTPEEDKPGAEPVVLLSEGFWERRFGRDPNVVGRSLSLSGESFTVVGVLPAQFHQSWRAMDVFTPLLRLEDQIGGEERRGNHPGIYVVGRLKDGVSVEQARTEVKALAERLAQEHPLSNARQSMTVETLADVLVGEMRPALLLLLGAVVFVLLIACVNVANLLLARGAARQKEIAVRMALGARRGRLVRQLLTESMLLSVSGGLLGIALAYAGVRALVATLPANVPRADEIRIDGQVLGFTVALALLTGLAFGLVPALRTVRVDLHDPLKEGGRGNTGGHHRLRSGLVVAEVALALVLMVGAGLLLRSFFRVLGADPGVRPEGVLSAAVPLPQGRFAEHGPRANLVRQVLDHARSLPGVEAAAVALPLLGGWQSSFNVEGRPEPPPGQRPSADITRISPDYFAAMGIPVEEGRVFDERDKDGAPSVCVIDESFARTHWPGESAIGRRVKFGRLEDEKSPWLEVVGVVGHVKNYGVDEPSRVEIYLPFLQDSVSSFSLLLRTKGDPASLAAPLRAAVRQADPELPTYAVRTLEEILAERTAQRRLAALLISVFASLALVLAAIGIYGVMSYTVSQRTQEIGVRMALGAERTTILGMVLRQGTSLALLGVGIGLLVAFAIGRVIASMLFETSPGDPPTFSLVPVVLFGVAALACYLPARRATRVDPMVALRCE